MWPPIVRRLLLAGILLEFEVAMTWLLVVETDWDDPAIAEPLSMWPEPLRGWMPWPMVALYVCLGIVVLRWIFPVEDDH